MAQLKAVVNGRAHELEFADNLLLLDLLREHLGLTGTKRSCEVQVCGACTVLVDGRPVSSCCYLAADIDGSTVETIEGLRNTPFFERVAGAFLTNAAVQCGFCTPGLILTLKWIASERPNISRDRLVEELRGNLCRCTGYKSIIAAAESSLELARS